MSNRIQPDLSPAEPIRGRGRRLPRGLVAALLIVTGLLGGGGYLVDRQVRSLRRRRQEELEAIAGLKAGQISDWYAARRRQVERILHNRLLQVGMGDLLAGRAAADRQADLQAWMDGQRDGTYARIALFDAAGRVRLQSPSDAPGLGEAPRDPAFLQALTGRAVVIQSLRRDASDPAPHLAYWVPVGPPSGGQAAGVLLLQVDSASFLAPLVEAWPVPSESAETQLVQREGGSVVYLNDQRFRPHSALSLRIPIAEHPDHPAVRAVLGEEGLVSGPDYRDVPVLAVLRQVPGTPWALIAKVDEAEIYRTARQEGWMGGLGLLALSALVAAGAGLLLRQRQLQEARHRLRLEREARAATERYRQLMDQASDIILLLDLEGRILEANAQAAEQYGFTPEELRGLPLSELRAPETRASLPDQLKAAAAGDILRIETLHRRRDGLIFPVEVGTRRVSFDGQEGFLSFIRDISERRAREEENRRLSRLYSALSQVNQAIVWSKSREALLAKICEVLVTFGGFEMAWIAWNETEPGRVRVEAEYGDHTGYLGRIQVRSDGSDLGYGPVGTALREDCPCVINDFLAAPETAPWHEAARRSGFLASAAFPIHQKGMAQGALAVYATERDVFGPHEVALLAEAAMDVSFALDHLAGEELRRRAEESLRESERFLREAEEAGGVGCYTWDIQADRWAGTPPLERIFGIGAAHPRNLAGWVDLVEPGHREALHAYVAALLAQGGTFDYEYPIVRPSDGALRWLHGTGELRLDAEGQPAALVGVIRDVTERKDRERDLERLSRLYAALSQVNQAIIRSRSRQELLDRICEAMVEFGRFSMAWFGWNDPTTHRVRVESRYGDSFGYLDGLEVRSDDSPMGQGPTGRALREGVSIIVNDFMAYSATRPWQEAARRARHAASAAFPIRQGGGVVGAFMVYAAEAGFFGPEETALLEEAASDVSFALDHLAGEARRLAAEEALRRQKEEFETIFNRVPSQIWYKDTRNRFLRVNDKVCQDLGLAREQIEGHSAEELFPEFAATYFRDDQEVFAGRAPKLGILEQINTASGDLLWLRTDKVPVLDDRGEVLGLLAIVEDLTSWRKAEEALHAVYTAMEQLPVSVLITDARGVIQYVNPAFTQMTGFEPGEAIGQTPRILKSGMHDEAFYRTIWQTLGEGRVWSGEIQNLRKDGTLYVQMSTLSPVRSESGAVTRFVAILEDVTERKQAEAERRELEAQVLQTQKLESLGSLAGGLAHDMNNVLGAILGLASMLREKGGASGPEGRTLDTIIQACLRGRGVVKSLLYFARKDLQEERPIDLNALVQEITQLLGHTTLKRVRLEMDLQEGLPLVRGDGGALNHALMNLCVNALDAMPEGGTLRLATEAAPAGGVAVRVKDSGEGMRPEVLARCLEPFFTTKPRGKGTGLGLSMVHSTMKAHDGQFELKSAPGEGTEAILRFPVSRLAVPDPAPAADGIPAPEPQGGLDVLLVDDDDLVRDSVTELLGVLGHRARAVPGGAEALAALEGGAKADLVILDMNMPGMSGAQALPRILALRPGLPVLLATGYSHEDLAPLLEGRTHVRSLSKPFSARELREQIGGFGIQAGPAPA